MKKLMLFAAAMCLGLLPSIGSADEQPVLDADCAGINPDCDYPCGPCVCECPYVHYKPEYYYTTRCVQEPYCVKKKCRRYVDQYYEVQKCRMVPEYYTVQCCRKVPEDYCVEETKYCTKKVRDCHCRYVPCKFTKRTCCYPNQCEPCGPGGGGSPSRSNQGAQPQMQQPAPAKK